MASMKNFFEHIKVVEINPTELCNLKCTFCPRGSFYPNQNLNMSMETALEIRKQLDDLEYTGELSITGRGEPTLHPKFDELSQIFFEDRTWTLKINTNGKRFDQYLDTIWQYDKIIYNLYEHTPEEAELVIRQFSKYGDKVRVNYKPIDMQWFERPNFTNRAGSFSTNHMPSYLGCDTPFVKMFIDWDGTYRLCCEDWKDKISMGNIFDQNIKDYINTNEKLNEYRKMLADGKRDISPCNVCSYNIDDHKNGCSKQKWKELQELVK